MSKKIEEALQTMEGAFGLYVGQLSEDELRAFNQLCSAGYARRSYGGPASIMGLPKAERLFQAHTGEEDQ